MKQRLTVLGSTGSIGTNTLDVVRRHPQQYEVFALSASTQVELMLAQCAEFRPRYAVMASDPHAVQLAQDLKSNGLPTHVLQAQDALEQIASHPEVDVVMGAIVGAAGLSPCLAAAQSGKRLLLANKEALVVGGALFMDTVQQNACTLLPIDSEHSAIFQCLPEDRSTWSTRIDSLLLTASGGPFRQRDPATLAEITPAQACNHPNFSMGRKISVDSATMMNKALEVIEARWLFDVAPEKIKVVIHPQQIIHSMVQFKDASILAQLGTPDMRVPIACGLAWPERIESGVAPLDFTALAGLTFEEADARRFPGLHLSWQALNAPEGTTAVLNAANEVAVAAFLAGQLRFDRIHTVNLETLGTLTPSQPRSVGDLLALNDEARSVAAGVLERFAA
ncbi:1-deoxy-D-xylulose-5-phosphate reductoisomerase [Comamonas aquatica]|uniref:1-deoxy-D-xylulose-5-phosphate reductoisomerase n=1 Tax=Comamonas aquatica TaxID=225991 RepID=UPI0024485BF7|nr:1-deoxy-D-xylulose-5-phosphate reductoisomerase [Comamonas aquatica]MDH0381159.1 1-deoxy-D-xylulose-5-phosphate reductoisomerase [Comamonas aquatica]MDH0428900.1 1-deoxy-D-xylulose-5-phosphate reductoisomerase [Comamonas aquatica]MDH0939362.1 1-deoxy-D-xylulose-5-phosphate reductoisomerase [Comamonas aquatica]